MSPERRGVLALVPARGGSKGIPRKNVRTLGGHPLVAYGIAAGLAATRVDRVVVSTDDEEIAQVAKEYGADVPFLRPAELAGDDVPDLPVFQHALRWLEEEDGFRPELVVHLRPTSPLRPAGCVDAAVEALTVAPDADSLRSVAPPDHTPYKMWRLAGDRLEPLLGDWEQELFNLPRQALPPVWWHTGTIDVARGRTIAELGSMTGRSILAFPVESRFAVDLDTEEQWEAAERALVRHRLEIVRPRGEDLSSIRLVVFDFDGVFTDNLVFVSEDGRETVACNRSDGLGISMLLEAGLDVVVVTTEENPVASVRCGKLHVECHRADDKAAALTGLMAARGVSPAEVAFVGNDVNDLGAMGLARWPIAVADAHPEVLRAARLVLSAEGGRGAVREVCDRLLAERRGRA
ncbi:MAG: acylneuraminate cytidylyltransferase [Actinomycetota bacterium]|nr:acylneuraminate cytidylyltransferase [Actinomycetota bacterium]